MDRHESYFRELTQDYVDFEFNGDDDAYEEYLSLVLPDVIKTMEHYSNLGNEFWLKDGKEMILGQLECPILLIDFEIFLEGVEELLGREVEPEEFAEPEKLLKEYRHNEFLNANPLAKKLAESKK